jgi:DNA-3-methyladenine glycosylase
MRILNRKFYERDTLEVAKALLGTEAYCGETDSACHAHHGKTQRNAVMFGKPGYAYVYFTYGMHYMLNLVTEAEGNPCAVLVRAIVPVMGVKEMEAHRKRKSSELTNGPAKICQALNIDKSLNGWDLTLGSQLWIENYKKFPAKSILATPRIGINYAKNEHKKAPWRFLVNPLCIYNRLR